MASRASFLRRFDLGNKSVEGILDRSVLGAVVTIASVALMTVLFLSELVVFINVDTASQMAVADFHEHDAVNVRLHVTFPHVECKDLEVIADNPRGNTGFLDIKTVEHRLPSKMEILPFKAAGEDRGSQVGCTLDGTLEVARAKGSIRVHVMHHDPARIMAVGGVVGITQGEKRTGPEGVAGRNVSHRIHDLAFGVPVGMSKGAGFGSAGQNPLAKSAFVSKEGAGQVRYSLKIVPISHMSIYGRETRSHTYSTNVGFLTEIDAMRAVTHSQQWLGVEFGYDFTPVMVRFTETRKSALEFVTSVCAIVGGIYTVSGLVVRGVNDISRKKHD